MSAATVSAELEYFAPAPRPVVTNAQVSLALIWLGFIASYVYFRLQSKPKPLSSETDVETASAKDNADDKPKIPTESPEEAAANLRLQVTGSGVVWGAIMFYMWLLDDRQVLHVHAKYYNRDLFLFILAGILLWAFSTLKIDKKQQVLSRDQTEEWKGWMQIMFLLYHYFAAKEYYNVIRVLIASYVWMTGYGNISYFVKTKDYSIWRVLKMLFRLNFLVIFVCLTMNTDYILYYICPMHTLWFLSVWITMAIKPSWNESGKLVAVKFAMYALVVGVVWEIPEVFMTVWSPLSWLLTTNNDNMHEWQFRSGLDHWATFVGMICGMAYPSVASWVKNLEGSSQEFLTKFGIGTIFAGVFVMWYNHIFLLPKLAYNAVHPYYSPIPIIVYIYFRNLTPKIRAKNMELLVKCGRITLETYLCQFHMWMCRKGDTYVGGLVSILDGYPLLNFLVVSAAYITISQWLFDLTTVFSAVMIPKVTRDEDWYAMRIRWGKVSLVWIVVYTIVVMLRGFR